MSFLWRGGQGLCRRGEGGELVDKNVRVEGRRNNGERMVGGEVVGGDT